MTSEEAIKWLGGIEKKYIHGGDESFDNSRKQAIHMAILSLEAQQWIPCSERFPKEDGRYLCTYKDIFYGKKNLVDFGLFDDGQWIVEPLAWMPLPQPWEDVDGEG